MKHWFAIYTKPRQEVVAEKNLIRQGFEVCCPKIQIEQLKRGKRVKMVEAMFPRYLFVCFSPGQDNISSIRYTRGVAQLVQFGNGPARVPSDIIQLFEKSSADLSAVYIEQTPEPSPGDSVNIIQGSFAGLIGIFQKKTGEERVIILLNILGEHNRVALNREQIKLATG